MSHFGRAGPPDIRDTYSLLVLNITFRTTADDLFPLFDKYGKVVDIFIPRDRRCKYADEAQKDVDRLDGRTVDGQEIMVQFAKYGPNAEQILLKEGLWKFSLRGPEAAAQDQGTVMIITATEIIEGIAVVEVEIGMNVTGIVRGEEIDIIAIEVEAAV